MVVVSVAGRRTTSNGPVMFEKHDRRSVVLVMILTLGALAFPNTSEVYAAVLGVLLVLLGLRSPRASWIVYLVAICLSGLEMRIAGLTVLLEHVALIPVFLHVLGAVINGSRRQRMRRAAPAAAAAIITFCFWLATVAITSFEVAPDPGQSLKLLAWVLLNLIAGLLFYRLILPTIQMVRDALVVLIGYGVSCALVWTFVTLSNQPNLFVERDYASSFFRLKGLMLEPNLIAALFVVCACVGLAFVDRLPSSLFNLYLAVTAVVVIATFTRVSGLVLVVLLVIYVWPRLGPQSRVFIVILALVVFVGATAGAGNDSGEEDLLAVLGARAAGILDLDTGTGAFRARTVALALEDMAKNGSLNGLGFNSFPQFHESDLTSDGRLYLGFLWLVVFYDGGFVGGLFFIAAFVLVWVSMGVRRGALFVFAFALIATSTNPIWFAFPWIFATLLMRHTDGEDGLLRGPRIDDVSALNLDQVLESGKR
jgi:hypothetical protein